MADMSYEDTQHLLDSITDPDFDQRLMGHTRGQATKEVDEVDMFTGLNNSTSQNPHAELGIENEEIGRAHV